MYNKVTSSDRSLVKVVIEVMDRHRKLSKKAIVLGSHFLRVISLLLTKVGHLIHTSAEIHSVLIVGLENS